MRTETYLSIGTTDFVGNEMERKAVLRYSTSFWAKISSQDLTVLLSHCQTVLLSYCLTVILSHCHTVILSYRLTVIL